MKIKVEFLPYEGPGSPEMESSFDVVELSTVYACSYEDWADAALDFVSTAGTRWDPAKIIQHALLVDGGATVKDWSKFVELMSDDARVKLREALG